MKSEQMYEIIGEINDAYVAEAAPDREVNPAARRGRRAIAGAGIAAALMIAASLVIFGLLKGGEAEFVVEDGVLVGYNGEGGEVVIPDGVRVISREAFSRYSSSSSNAKPITSLTFDAELEKFDSGILEDLDMLEEIRLDETGEVFTVKECSIYNAEGEAVYVYGMVQIDENNFVLIFDPPEKAEGEAAVGTDAPEYVFIITLSDGAELSSVNLEFDTGETTTD